MTLKRSQTIKIDVFFSEILTYTTAGFLHIKMLVCGWNLPYLEVNRIYTNDHSPDACTIPTF